MTLGIYYDVDTDIGSFKLSINHSETDKFYQKPTATYAQLAAARKIRYCSFSVTLQVSELGASRWKLRQKNWHET